MATARHLWTTTTLAQGLKIEEEEATAFVEKNAAALTAFFSAEGPQKIFILQAVDVSAYNRSHHVRLLLDRCLT
jgi:hypothetical protein